MSDTEGSKACTCFTDPSGPQAFVGTRLALKADFRPESIILSVSVYLHYLHNLVSDCSSPMLAKLSEQLQPPRRPLRAVSSVVSERLGAKYSTPTLRSSFLHFLNYCLTVSRVLESEPPLCVLYVFSVDEALCIAFVVDGHLADFLILMGGEIDDSEEDNGRVCTSCIGTETMANLWYGTYNLPSVFFR